MMASSPIMVLLHLQYAVLQTSDGHLAERRRRVLVPLRGAGLPAVAFSLRHKDKFIKYYFWLSESKSVHFTLYASTMRDSTAKSAREEARW